MLLSRLLIIRFNALSTFCAVFCAGYCASFYAHFEFQLTSTWRSDREVTLRKRVNFHRVVYTCCNVKVKSFENGKIKYKKLYIRVVVTISDGGTRKRGKKKGNEYDARDEKRGNAWKTRGGGGKRKRINETFCCLTML